MSRCAGAWWLHSKPVMPGGVRLCDWSCGTARAEIASGRFVELRLARHVVAWYLRVFLREFERVVPELAIGDDVWNGAFETARRCRLAGVTVPATDLLIDACARFHGAVLEHADDDFEQIAKVLS